jgi:acyl-coenzyme A synthetase/AMP-(fatty) acid ligase
MAPHNIHPHEFVQARLLPRMAFDDIWQIVDSRMLTLMEVAAEALARAPGLQAIEFKKRWYTWGELRRTADRVNSLIDASGADGQARIAFVPRNRPAAVAALFGLIARDRNICMLYAFQSAAGIARDIGRLKPAAAVFMAEDVSEEVRSALLANGIAGIALEGMDAEVIPGLERSTTVGVTPRHAPQIEILTSGTTGPPKQFALPYEMIVKHMVGVNVMNTGSEINPAAVTPNILFMPIANISGIYTTLPGLLHGIRGVLFDRFNIPEWHDFVLRYRPERGGLPPAGVQMVLDANIPKEDLACMQFVATGAAPLDPTVQRAFEERYAVPILLSYGATEFGGPVTYMTPELHAEWGAKKFGSVGRPFAGAQLRVIDADSGEVLPPGKEGILEVIAPRVGPNWIRTADVAVLDEDGFMFHRGRADGAIMRGGFKLLPETIERALLLHPAVSAAGVIGVSDHRLGQVPAAAVQFKPNVERPTIGELEAHLRNHVLATHVPVYWRIVEELPKTPSFKIDRPALRPLLETEIQSRAPKE